MQRIEAREGQQMDALLRSLYVEQELTVQQVADRLGITKGAASRWLERFGIDRRPTSWRRKES
jgi:predicted ArsR family transcriptional regulator